MPEPHYAQMVVPISTIYMGWEEQEYSLVRSGVGLFWFGVGRKHIVATAQVNCGQCQFPDVSM